MKLIAIAIAGLLCLELSLATFFAGHPFVLFAGVVGSGAMALFLFLLPRYIHLIGFIIGAILLGIWWQMLRDLNVFAWPFAAAMGVQVYGLSVALAQLLFPNDERLQTETNWVFGLSFGMALLPVYLLFSGEVGDIAAWLKLLIGLGFAVCGGLLLEFTREANPARPLSRNPQVLVGSAIFISLLTLIISAAMLGASIAGREIPQLTDRLELFVEEIKERKQRARERERSPDGSPNPNPNPAEQGPKVQFSVLEDDISLQDELVQEQGDIIHLQFETFDDVRSWGARPIYLRKRARDRFEGERWTNTSTPNRRRFDADDGQTDRAITLRNPPQLPGLRSMAYRVYYDARVDRSLFHMPRLERIDVTRLTDRGSDWWMLPSREARKVQVRMQSTPLRYVDIRGPIEVGNADERFYLLPDTEQTKRIMSRSFQIVGRNVSQGVIIERLTAYLRQNYRYSLKMPRSGKPGSSRLEDFLFHSKQGFCTYFATSLAVMLRCRGIPSRVAFGYTGGSPVPGRDARWRQFDGTQAHAWTEVFLKDLGWVVLEATPPSGIGGAGASGNNPPPPPPDPTEFDALDANRPPVTTNPFGRFLNWLAGLNLPGWVLPLGIFCLSLFLVLLLTGPRALFRRRARANRPAEPGFFRQFCQLYARKGAQKKHGQTPLEYLNALIKIGLVREGEFDAMIRYYYAVMYADAPRDAEREREFARQIKGKANPGA